MSKRNKRQPLSKKKLKETELSEIIPLFVDKIEDWRKQWRLHRKLTAKSVPLEFCLRPYFALLLYTLSISLLGRGLSHLQGENAYWALWWNESLFSPLTWLTHDSWSAYSQDKKIEGFFHFTESFLMWFFIILGVISAYAPRRLSQSLRTHGYASSLDLRGTQLKRSSSANDPQRLADPPRSAKLFLRLFISAGLLQLFYVVCIWIGHEYRWATLAEYTLQVILPFSCALMLPYMPQEWEYPTEKLIYFALSLCFIGHGAYALNIQSTPADFLSMTMNILSIEEDSARYFLFIFGTLDFVAALCIWLPIKELKRTALIYMIIWGALTAFARPLGQPAIDLTERLVVWGPEMLWRLSHMLIPLWVWQRSYD